MHVQRVENPLLWREYMTCHEGLVDDLGGSKPLPQSVNNHRIMETKMNA